MSAKSRFFLAKNGNISGPMDSEQVESLRKEGRLDAYTWLCNDGDSHWTPLDPAPPLPSFALVAVGASAGKPSDVTPPPFRLKSVPLPRASQGRGVTPEAFRVILFDHQNAVSGWLVSAHDGGCEIRSDQNGSDPFFVQKSAACLSVHDIRKGEALKIHVRLSAVQRVDKGWTYRLRWNSLPALEDLLQVS